MGNVKQFYTRNFVTFNKNGGSDLYISRVVIREWLESNILEYFFDTSTQVNEALDYFLKNKKGN